MKRMKHRKADGPDNIPVEVWRCQGERAVDCLTRSLIVVGCLRDGQVAYKS